MYIESVKNRKSPPCILLRESFRVGNKVRKRTIANLTKWEPGLVEGLRILLRGQAENESLESPEFEITRSLPHGHVSAVLQTIRKLKLDRLLAPRSCPEQKLVLAMIIERIIAPQSKLATSRDLAQATATSTVAHDLEIDQVDEQDLYNALDWLLTRQERIENHLAAKHLQQGSLVLYDLTSTYMEGTHCPLAKHGHPRDGKMGKLQIEYGLLCDHAGRPVAVKVFEGDMADPNTVATQIQILRQRFALARVIIVGDRGMLTEARIREDLRTHEGIGWISALRGPAIKNLIAAGTIQPGLFDTLDLAEIQSAEFPGERLVVCRNPVLAVQRRHKREALLQATEKALGEIQAAVQRPKRALHGQDRIGIRVGKVLDRHKVAKHFRLTITNNSFSFSRIQEKIDEEALSDGLYVIRSPIPQDQMNADELVKTYKSLSRVERAFRTLKTVDLKVRPVYHWLESRVRAHVFLCMLAYYVEWHIREALAPMLFQDDDKTAADAGRTSSVAPAQVSPRAQAKAATKTTDDDYPVHSFHTALEDLATITMNWINFGDQTITKVAKPTPVQQRMLELLGTTV